ncbi:MAG: tRNA adenosine(34) deaminase TadA [Clostridia bacterium]|nr:tRNA adenosine(34) deaminase TadA [Clostridia bacterium]
MNELEKFMKIAYLEAEKARQEDEVPVGAVIVQDGKVLAKGHNKKNTKQNTIWHAEMVVIDKAQKKLKNWHLDGCELYVTLEPCPMCAGACINSRVKKIVFGAYDPKAGCCGSLYNLAEDKRFNHRPEVVGGVMEKQCANILTEYFKTKRGNKK